MAIPKRARKGLQNINTHTDRTLRVTRPHRAFMRISAIEMEKARRLTEKTAMLDRLAEIDQRMRDLDHEKDQLLRLMGERMGNASKGGSRLAPEVKPNDRLSRTKKSTPRNKPKTAIPSTGARRKSGPSAHNHVTGLLRKHKPGPLRPLPERSGQGLKIRY